MTDSAQAQHDDFNVRVISDHIYAQHLYRDKLLRDQFRPTYHFAIPEGMAHPFDANGAFYWKGRYHLFYMFQTVRPKPYYRGDAWGHISSHDLVHWRHHPTALQPDEESPERAIYSGNMFLDKKGVPTIMYHGLGAGNSIARSTGDDMLDNWEKERSNPVIPYPEFKVDNDHAEYRNILDKYPEYGEYDVWDPHAWLDGDTYYSISGDNDTWPGKTALYKSKNLKDWELIGDFFHHDGVEDRLDCPDFFKLGDKYVLLYLKNGLQYIVGDFKNEQFHPEKKGTITWNNGVGYAPESLVDDKGRRIMWAALYDSRTGWGDVDNFMPRTAWAGTMSLPRVLSLDDSDELVMKPIRELQSLRHNPVKKENISVQDSEKILNGVEGKTLEIKLTIDPKQAEEVGIRIGRSPDGDEQTSISYNQKDGKARVDLTQTSLNPELMGGHYEGRGLVQEADFELSKGDSLNIHVFIDRSVLEVFVNNKLCLTHRIYPTREDSKGVSIFSKGGRAEVTSFQSWDLHPSNPY